MLHTYLGSWAERENQIIMAGIEFSEQNITSQFILGDGGVPTHYHGSAFL